jgi:hypothetical protein
MANLQKPSPPRKLPPSIFSNAPLPQNLLKPITKINTPFEVLPPASQPAINLDDHLFSTDEISNILKPIDGYYNPENTKLIIDKLDIVKSKIVINHRIDTRQYKDVFIISDIHADLRKFYSILQNSKMIASPFNPYNDDILNPELISNAEWIPENTLLIIVGDLVDGCREDNSVDDPDGSFELKLHILLYNLRLQAINMNSNIIFTLGNHDCETINENNELENYIHTTSYDYFNIKSNIAIRREALKPFYILSPYIFIVLSTPSHQNEIVCVHGGLHIDLSYNEKSNNINRDILEKLQSQINISKNAIELLNDYYNIKKPDGSYKKPNNDIGIDFINSNKAYYQSVWTRFYAEMKEEQCDTLNKGYVDNQYKMIVVGHCPTNIDTYKNITKIMNANRRYDHCQKNIDDMNSEAGCVITRCHESPSDGDIKGAPLIALVDTALSSAFRTEDIHKKEEKNNNRPTELLHLRYDSNYSVKNRYYNTISRFLVSPLKQREIMVYRTLSLAVAKHKYFKYKNKYALLKNKVL